MSRYSIAIAKVKERFQGRRPEESIPYEYGANEQEEAELSGMLQGAHIAMELGMKPIRVVASLFAIGYEMGRKYEDPE